MKRTLVLKRETLTELTTSDLRSVVAGSRTTSSSDESLIITDCSESISTIPSQIATCYCVTGP